MSLMLSSKDLKETMIHPGLCSTIVACQFIQKLSALSSQNKLPLIYTIWFLDSQVSVDLQFFSSVGIWPEYGMPTHTLSLECPQLFNKLVTFILKKYHMKC